MLLSVSLFPWKTVICVRGRQSGGGRGERGRGTEGGGERRLVREETDYSCIEALGEGSTSKQVPQQVQLKSQELNFLHWLPVLGPCGPPVVPHHCVPSSFGPLDSLSASSSLYNLDMHNQRRHTRTSPISLVDLD